MARYHRDALAPRLTFASCRDIIVGNETEAEALATSLELGTTDLKEIAQKLYELPKENADKPRIVVITHGDKPTIVASESGIAEYPIKVLGKEEIVDTNGAGDAFVGGFLAQLVAGKDLAACIAAGQWCACEIIKRSGCTHPEKCELP